MPTGAHAKLIGTVRVLHPPRQLGLLLLEGPIMRIVMVLKMMKSMHLVSDQVCVRAWELREVMVIVMLSLNISLDLGLKMARNMT